MTLILGLVSACAPTPLVADGGRKTPVDGPVVPVDAPLPLDAGGCPCQLGSDHILRMSWACLCVNYNDLCTSNESAFCETNIGWTKGCGLDVYTGLTLGGSDVWVFDHQSGAVIGIQYISADSVFTCPSNANLQSSAVAAGTFPDATCAGSAACGCTDAGPPCPLPDSGTVSHL
jgi:hypothetical protein